MRAKNPQEKKALKYKKERRTGSSHGYIKSYPKTKARINKASRHEANTVLKTAGIVSLENAIEVTDLQAITRERLQHSIERTSGGDFKAHSLNLKEWVDQQSESRVQSTGRDRYFARPYNSELHRKRFGKYLQTLLSGRSAKSAQVASFYGKVLTPSGVEEERHHARWRVWLRAFLRDEPAYEHKICAWIQEMEQLYPRG
jgi:hypothetical protein